MKKFLLIVLITASSKYVFAWGKEGHEMVAEMAFELLSPKVQQQVKQYLGDIKIPSAGTWMDDVRSDKSYNFMREWHYINISKGVHYAPTTEENVVNEILIAERELQHKDKLCAEQIKFDLLVLFHLIGDIHQPLHAGYGEDKGGNDIVITLNGKRMSLHKLWDTNLIEADNITLKTLEAAYRQLDSATVQSLRHSKVEDWVNSSRMYLPVVYNFSDYRLDDSYAANNKELVISQLLNASIRLAATLENLFGEKKKETEEFDASTPATEVTPEMVAENVGKRVKVCGKVYGVQKKGSITLMDIGAAYPNAIFSIVMFADAKDAVTTNLFKLKDKTICITGVVSEYDGKPQIKLTNEAQIKVSE